MSEGGGLPPWLHWLLAAVAVFGPVVIFRGGRM
jgi:hypothetical protein